VRASDDHAIRRHSHSVPPDGRLPGGCEVGLTRPPQ
jgi:hypothetical protein